MDIYAVRERIKKENINFMNPPLRVIFYARVSTEFNVQLNSLDNQITYYTDFIKNNPNWEYVEGYVDKGTSGVSTANRERFNKMIEDGKLMIDEEQAEFIRELFEMYATGKFSMKQMEKYFYQKGIRNSKGNKLSRSTMGNIISSLKYKSHFVNNKIVKFFQLYFWIHFIHYTCKREI